MGGGNGVASGLTRSDPACSFLAFVCRCGSDLSCRCRLMKQARRWWADISLGATFFDVISSVPAADKWRRPLLTAEALISGKEKKQKNKAAPFALRHVKTASSVRCVLVNTTGSGFIYQSVCFHADVELGSCLCPSLHASECVFFFFFLLKLAIIFYSELARGELARVWTFCPLCFSNFGCSAGVYGLSLSVCLSYTLLHFWVRV